MTQISYDSSTEFGTGTCGLYANVTSITFDNFKAHDSTSRDALTPRFGGLAKSWISSGEFYVEGRARYGEAVLENFSDDNYIVELDVDNRTVAGYVWVRYIDGNNGYKFSSNNQPGKGNHIDLYLVQNGEETALSLKPFDAGGGIPTVKIKVDGSSIKCWVDGILKHDVTDSTFAAGGVALGGYYPKFDNLRIGYDNNDDDDIDDEEDDVVIDEDFGGTSVTPVYDKAGNLIDDAEFIYVYDAWNHLVKKRALRVTELFCVTCQLIARFFDPHDAGRNRLSGVLSLSAR